MDSPTRKIIWPRFTSVSVASVSISFRLVEKLMEELHCTALGGIRIDCIYLQIKSFIFNVADV